MELTINGKVYSFKAGIGFLRKANKRVQQKVDGTDTKKEMGLQFLVAGLIDGDVEELIVALDLMNEGMDPRLTVKEIEAYIEDETTDIDTVFEEVLSFLKRTNATKNVTCNLIQKVEEQRQKEMQERQKEMQK